MRWVFRGKGGGFGASDLDTFFGTADGLATGLVVVVLMGVVLPGLGGGCCADQRFGVCFKTGTSVFLIGLSTAFAGRVCLCGLGGGGGGGGACWGSAAGFVVVGLGSTGLEFFFSKVLLCFQMPEVTCSSTALYWATTLNFF